jgi:hypothetical protein
MLKTRSGARTLPCCPIPSKVPRARFIPRHHDVVRARVYWQGIQITSLKRRRLVCRKCCPSCTPSCLTYGVCACRVRALELNGACLWLCSQAKPRPDRMNEQTVTWYLNRVFSPYPEYFGKPSKEQRNRWSEQLRWAMTIALSRAFGPRYPGAPFAMFVVLDTWVGSSVSPSPSLAPSLCVLSHPR